MGSKITQVASIRGCEQDRILGRVSAGTGRAEQLTGAQVRSLCSVYSTAEVDALIAGIDLSWGQIGGTLSNQTDLQAALDAKVDLSGDAMTGDLTLRHSGLSTDGPLRFGTSGIVMGNTWGGRLNINTSNGAAFACAIAGAYFWTQGFLTAGGNMGGSPEVKLQRNATGPKWTANADGGLEVKNLAGTADAPITALRVHVDGTSSGGVMIGSSNQIVSDSGHLRLGQTSLTNTGAIITGGVNGNAGSGGDNESYLALYGRTQPSVPSHVHVVLRGSGVFKVRDSANVVRYECTAAGMQTFTGPVLLGVYTFATVPAAAANTGAVIRISDRAQRHAYSDGTDWRWFADDLIIS